MLRGSRDFSSRAEYEAFLEKLFTQLNSGRRKRFEEELKVLHRLPERRLDDCRWLRVKVGPGSIIYVAHNVYSVPSRLIGETVSIRLYGEYFEVWYGQKKMERIPRLRGSGRHRIDYRHIIDRLVRKPGAFENYRYKKDLFPTTRFRMAYDQLKSRKPAQVNKEYLKILYLASKESESGVDEALRTLFERGEVVSSEAVTKQLIAGEPGPEEREVVVEEVDLSLYDELVSEVANGA